MSEPTSEQSKHVKKDTQELRKDAEELKKDAKELKRDAEPIILAKLRELAGFVKSSLVSTKQYVEATGQSALASTKTLAYRSAEELKNPVILVNVLLGSSVVSALLTGYAKYDARYLRDKSDSVILATVGSITALLALDTVLSVKYYPKFDKKK